MFLRHTGFFGKIWEMLGACFWGVLHRFGGSAKCCGHVFGMLGGPWGCFGGPWRNLGVLWVSLGRSMGILGALGMSWERPGGPLV